MSENKGVIITEVFLSNTQSDDLVWFTVQPPVEGEIGGRNRFDEYGNVIGYETWEWKGDNGDSTE